MIYLHFSSVNCFKTSPTIWKIEMINFINIELIVNNN